MLPENGLHFNRYVAMSRSVFIVTVQNGEKPKLGDICV